MSLTDMQKFDDQLLVRYLLGALPHEEAERLDELSVVNDEFALRLNAVENDLVDAYVRGELSGETLERFKSSYLASMNRREKVRFAEALLALEGRTAPVTKPTASAIRPSSPRPAEDYSQQPSRRKFLTVPRLVPQWALAAMVLILLAGSFLLIDNQHLRKQARETEGERIARDQHEQQLLTQLADLRASNAGALKELKDTSQSPTNLDQLKTVSLLLQPEMRGAGRVETLHLRRGTDLVVLLLVLESDDFPTYRIVLKDPATNQILWRSTDLKSASAGKNKAVSIGFRASLLKERNYLAELTGIAPSGTSEFISAYPFRAMLK